MIRRAAPPRRQRLAVLGTVLALHAALIAFFVLHRWRSPPVEVKPAAIALISIDAERPAAAKPPPPALPAKIADTFKPVVEFSIPTDTDSDAPAGATGACSAEAVVLNALLLDPAAVDAIRRVPDLRSVADALTVWNEVWNPATLAPDGPLAAVRANIERSLATAPDACIDEPVVGPRLLPIPNAAGTQTIFVVIGSGTWSWRALLTPPTGVATDGAEPPVPAPAGAR